MANSKFVNFFNGDDSNQPRTHNSGLRDRPIPGSNLQPSHDLKKITGGESGIRTHVRVSPKHAFQACAFSHSAISPAQVGTHSLYSLMEMRRRERTAQPRISRINTNQTGLVIG